VLFNCNFAAKLIVSAKFQARKAELPFAESSSRERILQAFLQESAYHFQSGKITVEPPEPH
jgi:hypothetical protein